MSKPIIDVSEWQGKINWDAVKPYISGAIIRLGFGSDILSQDDKFFRYNMKECERLGIPYGVYLYSYAKSAADVQGEINHTFRLLRECKKLSLPVYLDMEDNSIRGYAARSYPVWDAAVKKAGYRTGLYSGYYYRRDCMPNVSTDTWWLAWYNGTNGTVKPATGNWKYDLWQYTDAFPVAGMAVDASICYNDKIFSNGNAPAATAPAPTPAAKPAAVPAPKPAAPSVIVPRADIEIYCMHRGYSGKKVGGGEICVYDDAVTGLSIGTTGGGVQYRVHRLGGGWYGKIEKCDWKTPDAYAGDRRNMIDGIQVYFYTDKTKTGGKAYAARYSVKTQRHGWLPYVYDTNFENGDGAHTAGIFGDPIIGFRMTIVPV